MLLRCLLVASLASMSVGAVAQYTDESALDELDKKSNPPEVVREVPGAAELRSAMRRIAQQPGDADALADAGNAALTLGDPNAALNFLTRANALRPNSGKIVSGLASATVRTENPFEALRLFDDAVKLGVSERSIAADRALAFDLLGNFGRAQQDYNLARTASSSTDLIIAQAISLSLMGQKNEADGMLVPLLQKNDPAAWRARAFMLASRGDHRESTKVAQGFMDARSAQRMERYLRLMPDLTRAQQAAAIHLGHFPANNIGRDSEDVRRVASTIPSVEPAKNESRLIPAGEPLGQKTAKDKPLKKSTKADRKPERIATLETPRTTPASSVNAKNDSKGKGNKDGLSTDTARAQLDNARSSSVVSVKASELPPPDTARPLVTVAVADKTPVRDLPTSTPGGGSVWVAGTGAASTIGKSADTLPKAVPATLNTAPTAATSSTVGIPDTRVTASANIQGPTQNGVPIALGAAESPKSAPPVADAKPAAPIFDLAAVVGAIEIPESEQKPSAVPVDLKKLKQVTTKLAAAESTKGPKIDTKAKEKTIAVNPPRFWVQIATGEASALGYDYRRWSKKSPDLFNGHYGWTSIWGKTSRLLVGPFADLKASKKWEADFRKAGGGGFAWKSENGVVVTPLKGK